MDRLMGHKPASHVRFDSESDEDPIHDDNDSDDHSYNEHNEVPRKNNYYRNNEIIIDENLSSSDDSCDLNIKKYDSYRNGDSDDDSNDDNDNNDSDIGVNDEFDEENILRQKILKSLPTTMTGMYMCMYVSIYICLYVYMHVYICMHVCICGFSCIQISVLYIWR
jgi:hypothetical protein